MIHSRRSKVLAFFGSDVGARHGAGFLRKAYSQGYDLLALDSAAMALASRAGVEYTVLDDWLDARTIAGCIEKGIECENRWFEPARDEFTTMDVCWPEADKSAMKWFWPDTMLALELGRALDSAGCRELQFFRNVLPRAAVGFSRSDVCAALWVHELPGRASRRLLRQQFDVWRLLGLIGKTTARPFGEPRVSEPPMKPANSALPKGCVILVMGPTEELRFTHVIARLAERFPGRTAAVIAAEPSEEAAAYVSRWGVPVVFGPRWPRHAGFAAMPWRLLPRVDKQAEKRFLAAYEKAVKAATGQPWQRPLECLGFHFRYYCRYRWPYLSTVYFRFWLNLWREIEPEAVLVTSRDESIFGLVAVAAKQLGIRSFSLPHGGNSGFKMDRTPFVSDYLLCNSPLQKSVFESRGIDPGRAVGCRDLLAQNEYKVYSGPDSSASEKWRVLVLLESTDEGPTLIKYVSLRIQLEALKALVKPPEEIAHKVDLAIKVHPHISDLDMIRAAGEEVEKRLMPLRSDLHSALESADLVVAVNYRGTALIHAIRAGKSIAYFLTENEALRGRQDYPFNLLEEATTVVRTAGEFWELVKSFFNDSVTPAEMRRQTDRFFREQLDDSGFPDFANFVESVRSGKVGLGFPDNRRRDPL